MRCFQPDIKYLEQIKRLCCICFNMEADEVNYVFEHNYISTEICYAIEDSGELCCMLFTVPCTMIYNGKFIQGHYIYGACTLPEYRHRGLMHKLICYTSAQRKDRGDCFSVLLPANDSLYSFYATMGYIPAYKAVNKYIDRQSLPDLMEDIKYKHNFSVSYMHCIRNQVCRSFTGTIAYSQRILEYALHYAKECGGGAVQCDYGYIIYAYDDSGSLFVLELMCLPQHKNIMLGILKNIADTPKIMLRQPPWLHNTDDHFGMIKILSNKLNTEAFKQAYLGLTFD